MPRQAKSATKKDATVEDHGVKVSQDGRGRWMDNVMIERCGEIED